MANTQKHVKMIVDPVLSFDNKSTDSRSAFELLTITEVADFFRISTTGVRRLLDKRAIPFLKIGGSVRFVKSDLVAYMQKRRVESIGE